MTVGDFSAATGTRSYGGTTDPTWTSVSQADVAVAAGTLVLADVAGFAVKTSALSSGRAWGAAAAADASIYVIGGGTKMAAMDSTDQVLEYLPMTDTLTAVAKLPYSLIGTQAVVPPDGKVYVVMGEDPTISPVYEPRVLRFDPLQGTVTTAVDGMYAAYHHGAALGDDGLIYAFGGWGSGPIEATIEAFDPAQSKIVAVSASLPSAREKLAAIAAPNGNIYLFGGALVHDDAAHQGGQITDQILKFTRQSQSVELVSTAKLPQPLINVAGGLLADGAIYLVGGDTPVSGTTTEPTTGVHRFDPQTETLTTVADQLPAGLSGAAAAVGENGKLYLFGGRGAAGLTTAILELRPFATSGAAAGPVIDTGAPATACTRLDWQADTPAGTALALEIRAADTTFDQSAASPAWQPVGSAPVTSDLPSGRYLQWRARFTTSNTAVTPTLRVVSLSYGSE